VVGGRALYDAIGPFLKASVHGNYAIHIPFTKSLNMSAGLGLGWSNFGIREDRVVLHQADDVSYSEFLGNTSAQNILDVNAGITLYGKNLFVGISTTQLLKNKTQFGDVETQSNFNRHYFLIAKYQIKLGEELSIEPTVVGKIVQNSPLAADFGARLIYKKGAWFGIQYRTSNALTFQVGANLIKNIYISYGYELGIGQLRTANNGTHEVQLGFYLGKNRNLDKEIKEGNTEE
ncbi:MAG: type IX secretion system PorP/SprF family membrane protein, partial [Crocinitomicaceae bacterium]